MLNIIKPLHIAFQVSDLAKADEFYTQVIGLEKVERSLSFEGSWYQAGDFQVHAIVSATGVPAAKEDKWGRHPHISFAITDLEAVKSVLIDRQIPFQMSSSGRRALFVQDPDSNVVELLEVS